MASNVDPGLKFEAISDQTLPVLCCECWIVLEAEQGLWSLQTGTDWEAWLCGNSCVCVCVCVCVWGGGGGVCVCVCISRVCVGGGVCASRVCVCGGGGVR